MSDKYIIRNCPSCYYIYCDKEYECNWRGSGITNPCKDRTDCLLKRIVGLCKETLEQENDPINTLEMSFAQKILKLLDIQEIE